LRRGSSQITLGRDLLAAYRSTYPVALDTALRVLLFVARYTDRLLVTWYERLHADWLTTDLAAETLLVKLFPFELVLLHTFNSVVITDISV